MSTPLVTPYKKTHVWFDVDGMYVSEPAFQYGRPAKAMFKQGFDTHQLEYHNGWCIKAYNENDSILIERQVAQDVWFYPDASPPKKLQVASGILYKFMSKAPSETEMPGVATVTSADRAAQSFIAMYKSIATGTDFSTCNLSTDQTNYPFGPFLLKDVVSSLFSENAYIDETVGLDRVAASFDFDSEELDLNFYLTIYTKGWSGVVGRFYFVGPAGQNDDQTSDEVGMGQYALSIHANDKCMLFERIQKGSGGSYTYYWCRRATFKASGLGRGSNTWNIRIHKFPRGCKSSPGRPAIQFQLSSDQHHAHQYTPKTYSHLLETLMDVCLDAVTQSHPNLFTYVVPGPDTLVSQPERIRVDLRRDVMGYFALAHMKYPTTAITVDDAPFEMPFYPVDTTIPLVFAWTACNNGGTSATAKLIDYDTNTELPILGYWPSNDSPVYPIYSIVKGHKTLIPRITLQSDGLYTPVFQEWRVQRVAALSSIGAAKWEVGDSNHVKSALRKLKIRGAERDMAQENAELEIVDPLNKCPELLSRASMKMKIEKEYDPNDSTKRCVWFQGYAEKILALRGKPDPRNSGFPVKGWHKFHVIAKGMWELLEENFVDPPFTQLTDIYTGQPFRVVDIVKGMIERCGVDPGDISFPANDIRIDATFTDYSQIINNLISTAQFVKSLVRDYLTFHLIFDGNYGTNGTWRLVPFPKRPYNNPVLKFKLDGAGAPGSLKLNHYIQSYYTVGSTPVVPITSEVQTWVKKPEANWVQVAGIGHFNNTPTVYMSDPIVNPNSFGPTASITITDPDTGATVQNPDYLGRRVPYYVIDPGLSTARDANAMKSACNALARRIANLTFYGIKMMSFEAPLPMITHDLDNTKMRLPRYYDVVSIITDTGEVPALIRNVNPQPIKDGIEMAIYEIEFPRF